MAVNYLLDFTLSNHGRCVPDYWLYQKFNPIDELSSRRSPCFSVHPSPLLLQPRCAQIMHRKAASAKLSLMPVLALLHHSHDNSEIFLRTCRGTKLKLRRVGGGPPSCGPNKCGQATRHEQLEERRRGCVHGAMALISHSYAVVLLTSWYAILIPSHFFILIFI